MRFIKLATVFFSAPVLGLGFSLFFVFGGFSYSAQRDFNYYICVEKAVIYKTPELNSVTLTTLDYGKQIEEINGVAGVSSEDGTYFKKIRFDTQEGYVNSANYIGHKKNEEFPPLILQLDLKNGKNLQFKNYPCEGEQRNIASLLSYEKDKGFYVVKKVVYEGSQTILINDRTGSSSKIFGKPVFSPNRKRFFTSVYEPYVDVYVIAIYDITQHKPILKFKKEAHGTTDGYWDPNDVKWVSNNTVEYVKQFYGTTPGIQRVPKQIELINGKWTETD